MNTDKPHFADIKVGDKAWSFELGVCVCRVAIKEYDQIYLENKMGQGAYYDFNGKYLMGVSNNQTAFYQKPDIIDKGKPVT